MVHGQGTVCVLMQVQVERTVYVGGKGGFDRDPPRMHCMPQGMNEGGPGLGAPSSPPKNTESLFSDCGTGMMWGREKALSLLKGAGFEPEAPSAYAYSDYSKPSMYV